MHKMRLQGYKLFMYSIIFIIIAYSVLLNISIFLMLDFFFILMFFNQLFVYKC